MTTPDPLGTVYATRGGERFHKDGGCPQFHAAHDLWRFDPNQWVPGMPQIMLSSGHRLQEVPFTTAMGEGKKPCSTCFPGMRAAWYRSSSEEDFGHEPMDVVTNGKLRTVECVRCQITWPCASAIVLGLAPRVPQDRAEAA